jgi:tripartite-type tricarboxylate transporter receptor subunit TctC
MRPSTSLLSRFAAAFLLLSSLQVTPAYGQEAYPSRPIQVVIPFPPGGALDLGIRILQPLLSAQLGQPLVLVNRPGAGGMVGLDAVYKASADGYTVAATSTSTLTVVPVTASSMPYKISDFIPVGNYAVDASVLVVHADAPWKSYEELIEYARNNPRKLTYGSPGVGTLSALNMESLKFAYGIQIEQVPFPGTPQVRTALLGKHVDIGAMSLSGVASQLKAGTLRALISSASTRLPDFPGVPTLSEKGAPQAQLNLDLGLYVRAGTPDAVVRTLAKALEAAARDPSAIEGLRKVGMLAQYQDGQRVQAQIDAEHRSSMELGRKLNLTK